MDHRQLVRILSVARAVLGVALVVAPGRAGRRWIGEPATDARSRMVLRGLGARDVALGVGTLRALDRGTPVQGWVQAAALGDAADAVSGVLAARRLGPVRAVGTIVSAGAAAAVGGWSAGRVDAR